MALNFDEVYILKQCDNLFPLYFVIGKRFRFLLV